MTTLTRIEMVVYLQAVDLFGHCTAEQMVRIASIARQQRFTGGEQVYTINDPAEALYCVVEGGVRMTAIDGGWRRVAPAETFGVIEILSDRLRLETAVAEVETTAVVIDAEDFFDLLSNNIEIVKALFRQLLQRPANPESVQRSLSSPPGARFEPTRDSP